MPVIVDITPFHQYLYNNTAYGPPIKYGSRVHFPRGSIFYMPPAREPLAVAVSVRLGVSSRRAATWRGSWASMRWTLDVALAPPPGPSVRQGHGGREVLRLQAGVYLYYLF